MLSNCDIQREQLALKGKKDFAIKKIRSTSLHEQEPKRSILENAQRLKPIKEKKERKDNSINKNYIQNNIEAIN